MIWRLLPSDLSNICCLVIFSLGQFFCASYYSLKLFTINYCALLRRARDCKYLFVIENVENTSRLSIGRPITDISDIDIIGWFPEGDSKTASMQQPCILLL